MDVGYSGIAWFLISTMVGLWLKFAYIIKEFWHDEAFQLLYSYKPLSFILDSNDVHPPLFNQLTHYLTWFTVDPIVLRSVMLILSLMFGLVFFDTIRRMLGTKVALWSYCALNLSTTFAYYSVEFRSYMFVMLLTMLQVQAFNWWMKEEDRYGMIYVILSLAMVFTHYMAGLVILVQFFFAIKKKKRLVWIEYVFMGLFSFPVIAYMLNTLPKIQSFWFKDIGMVSLISTFAHYINLPENPILFILVVVIYTIIVAGMPFWKLQYINILKQLLAYILVPVVVMWIVSQQFAFYHHRYFMFGGVFVFALFGYSYVQLSRQLKIMKLLPIVMLSFVLMNLPVYTTPLKDSASLIQIDDKLPIVHTSSFSQSPYKVYLPDYDHYLLTGLTKEKRFTAGGSVIEDNEVLYTADGSYDFSRFEDGYYWVSDKDLAGGEYVYKEEGLVVKKMARIQKEAQFEFSFD